MGAQRADSRLAPILEAASARDRDSSRPATLYNGMIHPLVPYTIRGALWYQGERNTHDELVTLYGEQLETLIQAWRKDWEEPFPFYFVQLPNWEANRAGWVAIRDEMLRLYRRLVDTGIAVTIDVGDPKDIHPKNKQAVGKRLALWALAKAYDKDVVACGPLYRTARRRGNKMVITFDFVGGGLVAEGGTLKGFEIAGEDREFVPATARIDGDSVIVSSPEVEKPRSVRYLWVDNPEAVTLYNEAGLPASPFRTDHWPLFDGTED